MDFRGQRRPRVGLAGPQGILAFTEPLLKDGQSLMNAVESAEKPHATHFLSERSR